MPFTLPIIGIKLFVSWTAFFVSLASSAAISAAMWGVTKLAYFLRRSGSKRGENASPNYTIRSAVVPARWILGRARVSGVLCHFVARGREAYMILALCEGQCEGIESLYVNGKKVALAGPGALAAGDGRVISPASGDSFKGKITLFEHFKADGTQGVQWRKAMGGPSQVNRDEVDTSGGVTGTEPFYPYWDWENGPFWDPAGSGLEMDPDLRTPNLNRGPGDDSPDHSVLAATMPWSVDHKLNGISWVGVQLTQPDYGQDYKNRFWSYVPDLEFVVKGLKFTWPGQLVPAWSDNAAAVRFWWETVRRGRELSEIHRARFDAAYRLCDESVTIPSGEVPVGYGDFPTTAKRYTVNGLITSGDSVQQIEQQLDVCWCGHTIEKGGELRFEPGMDRTAEFTIGEDDLVEEPTAIPWTSIHQRINVIKADLAQSAVHDYGPLSLREFKDAAAIVRDGEQRTESVPLDLISDPLSAGRVMAILLRQSRETLRLLLRLKPGDPSSSNCPLRMTPLAVAVVTLPDLGLDKARFYLETVRINGDWTVSVGVREDLAGTYATTVVLPALKEREITFPVRRSAPAVVNLVLDEIAEVATDGTTVVWLLVRWAAAPALGTDVRVREKAADGGTANEWGVFETKGAVYRVAGVVVGKTYEVEVRHLVSDQNASDWVAAERLIAGDLTVPSDPTGLDVDFRSLGYRATWSNPADSDFDVALVYRAKGAAAVFGDATLVATLKAESFEDAGLDAGSVYRVWVKARDFTGNLSGAHGPVDVTPVAEVLGGGAWHAGSGAPVFGNVTGAVVGDLYVNQDNGRLWQRTATAWVDTRIDITPMGGELHVLNACSLPANSLGVNGDKAVSIAASCAGTVWAKENGIWTEKGSVSPSAQDVVDVAKGDADFIALVKGGPGETGPKGDIGDKGWKGITGSQGDTGPIGEVGEQGEQGIKGAQGDTGPIGKVGEQGEQGIQGAQGDTGAKGGGGPRGWKGIQGTQGVTGSKGGVGKHGFRGIQGTQGRTGAKGSVGGLGLKGIQGTQGDTGAKGGVGPRGWKGIQGTQGDTGAKGGVGARGLRGFRGTQGNTGPKGSVGGLGLKGIRGAQGNTGPKGSLGKHGFRGNQGAKGATGVQGVAGSVGSAGDVIVVYYSNAPRTTAVASLRPTVRLSNGDWATVGGVYRFYADASRVPV